MPLGATQERATERHISLHFGRTQGTNSIFRSTTQFSEVEKGASSFSRGVPAPKRSKRHRHRTPQTGVQVAKTPKAPGLGRAAIMQVDSRPLGYHSGFPEARWAGYGAGGTQDALWDPPAAACQPVFTIQPAQLVDRATNRFVVGRLYQCLCCLALRQSVAIYLGAPGLNNGSQPQGVVWSSV